MAASGYTPIILFNSGTASNVPTTSNLAVGELAINYADGKLYYNTGSAIKVLAGAGGAGIAGGSNTQVQYNSSGNLAGSANLTFDGTNLTLGGGTANGVAYLNGSKVLTTGSALTFDGSQLVNTGGALLVGLAASTGTTGTFRAVTTSGGNYIQSSTNNGGGAFSPLIFTDNGASNEYMRLTSTGLGIGTSSPQARLNVVDASSTNNGTIWLGSATYYGTIKQDSVSTGAMLYNVAAAAGGGHQFQVGGTTLMNLVPSGNLGLGVTPSAWSLGKAMQIGSAGDASILGYGNGSYLSSNAYYNGAWTYAATTYASQYRQVAGQHQWYTAPSGTAGNAISFTQAMTLDNSGRLLLGATSGTTGQLIISSNGASQNSISFVDINGAGRTFVTGPGVGTGNVGDFGFYDYTASQVGYIYTGGNSGKWAWYTAGAERARIDSSGNLLVGTTSASTPAKVFVSSNCNSLNAFNIQDTGTTGGALIAFYNSANANAGYIAHNGSTTVQYITSSDYRLKENIAPMTGALDKVALLKPCTYTWKNDKTQGQGFIAHELQTVVPDAVYGVKDAVNEDGSIKAQGIDTSFLVATLTAAIQELKAEFDAYKASHP